MTRAASRSYKRTRQLPGLCPKRPTFRAGAPWATSCPMPLGRRSGEADKTVTPSPHHPLGAKGVGELATLGTLAGAPNCDPAVGCFSASHAELWGKNGKVTGIPNLGGTTGDLSGRDLTSLALARQLRSEYSEVGHPLSHNHATPEAMRRSWVNI